MLINDWKPYAKESFDYRFWDSFCRESSVCWQDSGRIHLRSEGTYPDYPTLGATLGIYDDDYGEWRLFGGYCLPYALVRAQSFESAYDIYLEEFVRPDEPEDEQDYENGYVTNGGQFYSESTTCYVYELPLSDYVLCVELKPFGLGK